MNKTIEIFGINGNEKQLKVCDIIQDDLNTNNMKYIVNYIDSPKGFTFKKFIIYSSKEKITNFINKHNNIITIFKNRLVKKKKNI